VNEPTVSASSSAHGSVARITRRRMCSTLSPGVSRTRSASTRSGEPLSGPVGGYSTSAADTPYGAVAVAVASVGTLVAAIVSPSGTIAPAPSTQPETFASAPTLAPGPTIEARTTDNNPTAAPGCSTLSSSVAPAATRASAQPAVRAPSVAPGSTSAVGAIQGAS